MGKDKSKVKGKCKGEDKDKGKGKVEEEGDRKVRGVDEFKGLDNGKRKRERTGEIGRTVERGEDR